MMSYDNSRPRKRRWPKILSVFGIVLVLIAAGGIIEVRRLYSDGLKPVSSSQRKIIVTIPTGSTVKSISSLLRQNQLIRSTWVFEQYISQHNLGNSLQAGTYILQPNQGVADIVLAISEGKIKTDLATILPGQRLDQIRKTLIRDGYSDADVDASLVASLYKDHPALVDKPVSANLEGYLYPDSYQKTADTTPQDIIRLSLDQMQKRLTPDVRASIEKQHLTMYEGIILASIVEQEVSSPDDKAQAAQVFLKRLSLGMPLGSDVTVIYGALVAGQPASLEYDSLYNTHTHKGLPPGPISNVSQASLQAVAHPANTDWLFFVSGDDGITYFSKTLEEHQALTALHCKKLCS